MDANPPLSILVIIGPSGVGKSTLVRELVANGLVAVTPTWTTRPPREREIAETVEHVFVNEREFDTLIKQGFFVEHVQLFGLPYRYGIPAIEAPVKGKIPLVMLRAPLLPLMQKHYPEHIIYQIEAPIDFAKQSLADRQLHGEQLGSRLEDYTNELELGRSQAHRVFVNTLETSIADELARALRKDFVL